MLKNRCGLLVLVAAVTSILLITPPGVVAQILETHGQNVVPVYEGWRKNADGSYAMFFGYFNRNSEEQVNIPIGGDNSFDPPAADRGQPTHFYPRRSEFVFSVTVPSDWGQKDLVWTLASHGKSDKAYGTLRDIYEVDNELIAKNMGAGSFGLMLANSDQPPSVAVEPAEARTALTNATVRLTATVTDDGIPRPALDQAPPGGGRAGAGGQGLYLNVPTSPEPRRPRGLSIEWIQYRGPGSVTFEPAGYRSVTSGGKASTVVTFKEPGLYVIRAIANDSLLYGIKDVTITVSAR